MQFCGILNLDKPIGLTSRDVVDHVVRLVRPAKAGHAGTLDPLATGVLVVCVGHATRLINLVQEGRKRYLAQFLLGQRSNTDDITGNIEPGGDWTHVTEELLAALLPEFTGRISQVPPQFSAIHVQGRRAYDLARRGEVVELAARPVEVFTLRLTDFRPPEFELEIVCGSGTYVRSIGRDLGQRLGCGAVMSRLRRSAVGPFDVAQAVTQEALTAGTLDQFLQPAICAVSHLPQRTLNTDEVIAVRRGQSLAGVTPAKTPPTIEPVAENPQLVAQIALVGTDGQLLGIGELDPITSRLQPRIVFPHDAGS
jgi:tRNA pseudouridine55 synthase